MDKQTTLAFILIGVILVVWLYFNSPEPQEYEAPAKGADTTSVKEPEERASTQDQIFKPNTSASTGYSSETSGIDEKEDVKERIITVETPLVRLELTSKGARIRRYFLKEYDTWYRNEFPDSSDWFKRQVQLINDRKNGGDLSMMFVTKQGALVETAKLNYTPVENGWYYKVAEEDSVSLVFRYNFDDISYIEKKYTFRGDKYASEMDLTFINMQQVISGRSYDLLWSNGINFVEKNSVDEANYANASAYSGGEQVIVNADSEDEKELKDINGRVDWIGVKNKYFAVIISPDEPDAEGGASFEGEKVVNEKYGDREYYTARLKVPFNQMNKQTDSYQVYIGPIEYDALESYGRNYEAIYDFGSFFGLSFIIRPISEYILLPLFKFLHLFIPNYGFVIIVFSIIIKLALWPLSKQSFKSMRKMQLLQPKIKELKEKYPDDQQRVQKETMQLYSTYGVNPTGGCLPMFLQMPILIALFSLFNIAIEIRNEPFIWWIDNLAAPDVILQLPFSIPLFGVSHLSGLALLMGVTMFFQQKMSVKDPSQKALVYVMPVMFTVIFMGFPAGLNLYYFMFNLLSIIQQKMVNRSAGDEQLVPVKKGKQKKGFMQKMMEAAEQQQKGQQNTKKKKKI